MPPFIHNAGFIDRLFQVKSILVYDRVSSTAVGDEYIKRALL